LAACGKAFVLLKVKNSGEPAVSIADIPLKPRIQPVNEVAVFPVYVIISLSIFKRPYSEGNPLVLATVIVVSVSEISDDKLVDPVTTSGTKLSDFKYWSKFVIRSLGPPWNSCEM